MCDTPYCDRRDCSDCSNEIDVSNIAFSTNGDLLITSTISKTLIDFVKDNDFAEFCGGFYSNENPSYEEALFYQTVQEAVKLNLMEFLDDAWHETYVPTPYFKQLTKQLNL